LIFYERLKGGGQNENTGDKSEGKGSGVEKTVWTVQGRIDSKSSEG
jgi:hypothetical protein